MLKGIVQGVVVSFVVRQLGKFQHSVDWDKVMADADKRVRAIVPGTWFDDEAVGLVDAVIVRLKNALGEGDELKALMDRIAAGDYAGAVKALLAVLDGE